MSKNVTVVIIEMDSTPEQIRAAMEKLPTVKAQADTIGILDADPAGILTDRGVASVGGRS